MFADVALPKRRYQVFTYLVPSRLHGRLRIGSRVLVPLGRTTTQGLVFHLAEQAPQGFRDRGMAGTKLREIADLIDSSGDTSIDSTLISLAGKVAEYYLSPPAAGLRLIIPPTLPGQITKRVMLTELGRSALNSQKVSPLQASLLTRLSRSSDGLTLATLRKTIKNVAPLLTRLRRKEWIVEHDRVRSFAFPPSQQSDEMNTESYPSARGNGQHPTKKIPTQKIPLALVKEEGDEAWEKDFRKKLSSKKFDEILLYDSWVNRQRCLIQAVNNTVRAQRTALVLTPEINQASRMVQLLENQLDHRIGLYHGDLSQRVRVPLWHAIREGQFDIVVGTRIALFLPLPSLGLIWVEREEDSSFKEEQSPSYHAREVARMRAKLESGVLVLSSPHPSLETIHHFSDQTFDIGGKNPHAEKMPTVRLVNLQQSAYGTLLSEDMVEGMQKALGAKGSVILFLNRKGFSRALMCRDCGHVPPCSGCGVALTLYKKPDRLVCSYCGQTHIPPVMCSACKSIRLEPSGFGTERLEEIVQRQFPVSTVARFDREMVKTPQEEAILLERFKHGKVNILIGTELLFHFPNIPRADFVGIPYADGGLHMPDFRSAERTYRLLEQAIMLAAAWDPHPIRPEVVLQTYLPTHHVIQAVVQRNARIFYEQELAFREALGYPPFTHLIQVAISGKHLDRVALAAKRCRDLLAGGLKGEGENILGPISTLRPRSREDARYVVVIKSQQLEEARQSVQTVREELELALRRERMTLEVNVDPLELL